MTSEFPIEKTQSRPGAEAGAADKSTLRPPRPWILPPRSIATRLFLTCWIVYSVHVATNAVREVFPAITLADHFSFRIDEYAHMHSDFFEMPGRGWYIDGNPGVSMIAAVPYSFCAPIVNRIVAAVNRSRAASGLKEPPQYNSPWPMAREFYAEAWRRGLDVKIGLAAILMQALCMAPASALGVVAMFWLLRRLFGSDRAGFWLSLLYAFGTPVFFRAGILNHNMMMGHLAFIGFLAMWNPGSDTKWPRSVRFLAGGFAGGLSVLLDYSGAVMLAVFFCYAAMKASKSRAPRAVTRTLWWFCLGAAPPILLLWFYQWRSFGNFILPVEHWMPLLPGQDMHAGYQGFTLPRLHLVWLLLADYRFGLFVTCPLLLLAVASPWVRNRNRLWREAAPALEFATMLLLCAGFVAFFGGWNSVVIQYTFGLRYLAPILPFLFVPAAMVMMRLPRRLAFALAVVAVAQAWSMAMYRDVERGFGVLDTVLHVFIGGFQLPALTVFSRMGQAYGDYAAGGVSPLPVFAVVAALLFVIWWRPSIAAREL